MEDKHRQALAARNAAEKAAVAAEQRVANGEHEKQRLACDLADAREEMKALTKTLGELRGERAAVEAATNARLAERDTHLEKLENTLEEAQTRLCQYVDADRSLVQELVDERRARDAATEAPSP